MFDIKFIVKTDPYCCEQFKIIGSLPSLGEWNPSLALTLSRQHDYWQSPIIQIEQNKRFQFKIIKERSDGVTQWQILPNNSNRKFKVEYSCKLSIQWSSAQGSVCPLGRSEFKNKKKSQAALLPLSNCLRTKLRQQSQRRSRQQFDPYKIAHEQDSTDSQEERQFFLVKRKMSDEIVMNSSDLQEIYNKSSALEIYWDLLTKDKVYVVYSDNYQQSDPFYQNIKQQLGSIAHSYHVKWIPLSLLLQHQKKKRQNGRSKNEGSMFDIREQQMSEQSLFGKSSFFIFSDVSAAVRARQKMGSISSCLYAKSEQYQQVIESFDAIRQVDIVCFDTGAQNEQFCDFLEEAKSESQSTLAFIQKYTNSQSGLLKLVLQSLKQKKDKQLFTIQTQQKYAELQAIKRINTPNTVTILDAHIFQSSPQFCSKIIKNLSKFSMIIIVTKGMPSQKLLKIGLSKNIVLVYDDFQRIRMQGNDYNPLRRWKQNLQLLRMKIRLYVQNHGGSITQRQQSIIYTLPETRLQAASKIYDQLSQFISRHQIGRVSLKGTRLKINWNFASEARFLRTICEIKYLAFGPLGNFNIVSDLLGLRQLKDALKLLVQHHPTLFLQKSETTVRYFSYGKGKTATCHILPESNNME